MGWDRGRYYTRSKKVGGRVVREYIGTGLMGKLAAKTDALARERRQLKALAERMEKVKIAFDPNLNALIEITDLLARAALRAAGYHQHKRGEWRKRREPDCHD